MRVLVALGRLGPMQVWTLPDDSTADPQTAKVPDPVPGVWAFRVAAKGPKTTWQEWAAKLARSAPYAGRFTVWDAPDGLDARGALEWARRRAGLFPYLTR